ncbi:hypothetical protein ACFSTA_09775 [Ornithinibacillus salinisoli]|uniref:DUF5590 domain-containing protein n=1 Tax=Ornithinibacillus salinisoli TaxID=1848459 RepID=A0ABW4VZK3_9BACI
MRKELYRLGIIAVLLAGIIIYVDFNNRISSFSTPTEALRNLEDPTLEIQEILETIYVDDHYAYLYFYSEITEPKDYICVSTFRKGTYGWKYVDMFGGGKITKDNTNGSLKSGDGDYLLGFATAEVASVQLEEQKADLLPLVGTDFQLWVFHRLDPALIDREIQFFDTNGKVIH